MIGKKIKVTDYKFTYGQDTVYINTYSAFKNNKNGNKYVIYSYENNNNLYYGTYFQRGNEAVIMSSKENPKEEIKEFIDILLEEKENNQYEILSLDMVESAQIIEEYKSDFNVDINKLHDLTIPKPVIEVVTPQKKKRLSISLIFFLLFVIVVIAFFIVNPEVIVGKNKYYICNKTYTHSEIPAQINEEISLTFDGKEKITNIDVITDYVFSNTSYYKEFKSKGYYYQYMDEGNTYKFIEENYTYRVFSKINTEEDFFLPTEKEKLIYHYTENNYTCKVVEENE